MPVSTLWIPVSGKLQSRLAWVLDQPALVKDTSLASTITVMELTRVAEQVRAATFRYMEMFLMIGTMYWLINQVLTILQTWLKGRWTRHMR
ncbi:hypothetical protein [Pseudomonas syringae]|uniref:hypothetical protein n=1 Tax=Pseudomonas syringae TaxID=317 RepID=UPI001F27CF16|nr:hypothetical protein [Pseudomonas syringae]